MNPRSGTLAAENIFSMFLVRLTSDLLEKNRQFHPKVQRPRIRLARGRDGGLPVTDPVGRLRPCRPPHPRVPPAPWSRLCGAEGKGKEAPQDLVNGVPGSFWTPPLFRSRMFWCRCLSTEVGGGGPYPRLDPLAPPPPRATGNGM